VIAVTFNGLTLDGSADANGVRWGWARLGGWWEGGAISADVQGRSAADGSTLGTAYHRGRAVTLEGVAWLPVGTAPTTARTKLLYARRKVMVAAECIRTDAVLTVDEGDQDGAGRPGVLRATVRRNLPPIIQPQTSRLAIEWMIPLVSAEWRKLSNTLTTVTVGGGGAVTNPGDAPATPTLVIHGPTSANPGVHRNGGAAITSSIPALTGGQTLTIDNSTGRADRNGTDVTNLLDLTSRFFDLDAGVATTVTADNIGAGSMDVVYRASWL
jgi:hypothetical protein